MPIELFVPGFPLSVGSLDGRIDINSYRIERISDILDAHLSIDRGATDNSACISLTTAIVALQISPKSGSAQDQRQQYLMRYLMVTR